MDEKDHFLTLHQRKPKKKSGKSNINHQNKHLKKELFNIPSKYYISIIIILIIIICFLIIKLKKISKQVKIQNIYYKEDCNINNNSSITNSITKRLFQYKADNYESKKNQIHISMAIDNFFIYPTLVSMTSALENNNNEKNIIVYHLLLSYNFDINKTEIFDSLKKKYEVIINYYIIPNIFEKYRTWSSGTRTVYFKILLPLIMQDLPKIIYLDADTLIFKDLYEMYNLPFNDNYVLGYPFHDVNKIDKFVENAIYYVNGGVLLFNINKIRKDNKDIDLIAFTLENNNNLWFLEQDSINVIFFKKIGILPLKYGIYMYGNIESFEKSIQIRIRYKLNRTEVIEAIDDPAIVHFSCCNPKVWNKISNNEFGVDSICKRFHDLFYYYANKTDYYSEIYDRYMK